MNFSEPKGALRLLLTFAASLFCAVSSSSAATKTASADLSANHQQALPVVDFTRLQFSPGILDIVRMVKGNVNPEVIKAFINHSAISYNPSAQEVIALRKLGVANDIVVTMIGHRARFADSAQPRQPQTMRAPGLEEMPALPVPSVGAYPLRPYPVRPFPVLGSLTSFNNSYPTFVNGQAVYSGYYLQTYPLFW